jgi:hypothetical protein
MKSRLVGSKGAGLRFLCLFSVAVLLVAPAMPTSWLS